MKNEDFDHLLKRLTDSTRSPRGRFSASNSWKLLEQRMHRKHTLRRLWLRTASAAAIVLFCMAGWAAYHWLAPEPSQKPTPVQSLTNVPTAMRMDTLTFKQMPLQEIARQLSGRFGQEICIDDDSLKTYRMTGNFCNGETLYEILDLLKGAGSFTYTQTDDTIHLIRKLN